MEPSRRLFWRWFGLDQDRMGGLSEGEDSNRVCEGNLLDRLATKAWSDSKWKWLEGAGCVFSGELSLMHSSLFQACLVQAQAVVTRVCQSDQYGGWMDGQVPEGSCHVESMDAEAVGSWTWKGFQCHMVAKFALLVNSEAKAVAGR